MVGFNRNVYMSQLINVYLIFSRERVMPAIKNLSPERI